MDAQRLLQGTRQYCQRLESRNETRASVTRFPQKNKRSDFCGVRPEMWKLFQDNSCSVSVDCLKLNSGSPTVNTLSFCSVTVSELILPLSLRVDVRRFTIRAAFFATQTLGKRFFLSVPPCAVNYFLTGLSTTEKLTCWLVACHLRLRQLSQREPVARSGEHIPVVTKYLFF